MESWMVYVRYLEVSGRFVRAAVRPTRELALESAEAHFTGARLVRGDPSVVPIWLSERDFDGLKWWELTADGERAVTTAVSYTHLTLPTTPYV